MKKKPENKKAAPLAAGGKLDSGQAKGPGPDAGEFRDLLPGPGPEAAAQLEQPARKKKRRKGLESLAPFVDEKTLGFIWRNVFLIFARVSKNPAWEITGDEESQLADGTNKVLSKHLPAWLEDYLEEFSLAITLGFIFLSRMRIPESPEQATKLEMPPETKIE
jgi:hypothetical protein